MRALTKILLFTTLVLSGPVARAIDITVQFDGGLTPSQEAAFTSAEQYWESVLVGYQPGITISGPVISAAGVDIDGGGDPVTGFNILGQATPTHGVVQGGYVLTTAGFMHFDVFDLPAMEASGNFADVILHEMAHVLGFGTLWGLNGVYDSVNSPGEYLGLNGIAAYQDEFDPLATFVPVELDGGPGTVHAHWDETWAGGAAELMTGYLNPPTFISDTTLYSFVDIGFRLPLPTTLGLILVGAVFVRWRASHTGNRTLA